MSPHLLLLLLTLLLPTLAVRRARPRPAPLYSNAPSARIFAAPNPPTRYEQLYRSYLAPLDLYAEYPANYAPLSSPRGRDRLSTNLAAYQRVLDRHAAYIGPGAGESIPGVLSRMYTLTDPRRASTRAEQQIGQHARFELRNALHPENVSSQHRSPLVNLHSKYKQLLQFFDDPQTLYRLTNQLTEEESQSVMDTMEVLNAEKHLLEIAANGYAAKFPHLT